ncbi:MAG: hypothetical protein IKJ80_03960 [Clostridia bacterium]|nr:hypothetical protein [Clostridia bacterium]
MENKKESFNKIFLAVTACTAFIGAIVAAGKVIFGKESHTDDKKGEDSTSLLVAICVLLVGVGTLVGGVLFALRSIRKVRGGYIIDLFDRDEYDVISPEEEDNFEVLIRGELRPSGDDDCAAPKLSDDIVPVDEDTNEDNYN